MATHVAVQDISQVDPRMHKLVHGFCRRIHASFPTNNVYYSFQKTITDICFTFYWIGYQWHLTTIPYATFQENEQWTIINKTDDKGLNFCVNNIITSFGIYRYQFLIHCVPKYRSDNDFIIGIVPNDIYLSGINGLKGGGCARVFSVTQGSYSFYGCQGVKCQTDDYWGRTKQSKYGKRIKNGDKVTMTVNMIDGILSYKINKRDHGVAHYIKTNITYRACVYLFSEDCKIEIL